MHSIDPMLLELAAWRLRGLDKEAFVPADAAAGGMDPSGGAAPGGAAPPMDPSMMGGGAPAMDPAMMAGGGAPPMDPAMAGGGATPPPPPTDPTAGAIPGLQELVTQAVQQAMQQPPAGAAGGPAGPGKGAKIDPGMIYLELGRVRKLMTTMFQRLGWELPPDILDDQAVAQSAVGQSPTSQPLEGSSGGGGGASPGLPGIGLSPPIKPIAPAEMGKQGSIKDIFLSHGGATGLQDNCSAIEWLLANGAD